MAKRQQELSKCVENDEPLARYIFSTKDFSSTKRQVKRRVFKPHKSKISVFRYKNCPESCVLKIGQKVEIIRGGNTLKAVCSVLTRDVRSLSDLDVKSDTTKGQHRRHANIINFEKYEQAKVNQLASKLAKLVNVSNSLKIYTKPSKK